jgi:hypothetical protein
MEVVMKKRTPAEIRHDLAVNAKDIHEWDVWLIGKDQRCRPAKYSEAIAMLGRERTLLRVELASATSKGK